MDRRVCELSAGIAAALRKLAEISAPKECCGLLLGHERGEQGPLVIEVVESPNRALGCENFALAPEAFVRARQLLARRSDGSRILGFYHSHPNSAPRPSARDRLGQAHWSDSGRSHLNIIIGRDEKSPNSWRLAIFATLAGDWQEIVGCEGQGAR